MRNRPLHPSPAASGALLQLQRQLRPARPDDAAVGQHMDMVGLHVIEQALIVGDQQHRLVGLAHDAVDAVADDAQRVDVEARIRLVEDRELGVDDAHLHHLVALLLAARKADVDRALEHLGVHFEARGLGAGELQEFGARQRLFVAGRALGVQGLAQELDVADAGDFDRVLEAEEQAGGGAFIGFEVEQVDPFPVRSP